MKFKYLALGILAAVHLFLLTSLQFTLWPEMMSYPYFFNQDYRLYSDFIYPYTPLLTWMLAGLYQVFGYKLLVVEVFVWSLLLVNDVLVYLIVKDLSRKEWTAWFSAGAYVLLQPIFEGNMIWFDVVVATPLLAGFYLLLKQKYAEAGVVLAVACLIKQTAGLYVLMALLYLVVKKVAWKDFGKFMLGPVVLGLGLLAYVMMTGSLGDFLNWTLIYPFTEWGKFSGYVQMELAGREKTILVFMVLPVMFLRIKGATKNYLLLLFLLASFVSVYPRFSWFHMQAALAFLVVEYGVTMTRYGRKGLVIGILLVATLLSLVRLDIVRQWGGEVRFWSDRDWEMAEKIAEAVPNGEQVYLLGLQSGFYSMSDRLSPVPWVDSFGWYLEIEGEQEKVITRWEEQGLRYVIWRVPGEGESELGRYQPELITKWIEANYNKSEEMWEGTYLWERKD